MLSLTNAQLNLRISIMQQWINRQDRKKKNWSTDDLWAKIKTNWPTLHERDLEKIYQNCCVKKKEYA